jgi:hypothetical protein
MSDADRNASLIAKPHQKSTVPINMTVKDCKWPILLHHTAKTGCVLRQSFCIGPVMYVSAEIKYFLVKSRFGIATNQKVKLKLIPVDVPHHMH